VLWRAANLDHGFGGEAVREELLRSLLELNFEIAAKEQSAVSNQPKGKTAGKRDGGKRGKKTVADSQLDLF
jgi:hypothetical protein